MTAKDTIVDIAQQVLRAIGRPASIEEIYAEIVQRNLYVFNSPTPEHVLRTTIRRHTDNVERVDSSSEVMFHMVSEDVYGLKTSGTQTNARKRVGAGMKRIQRAVDKEEIIKSLMSEQVGVFKEIWKLLLFAAQIGVRNKTRSLLKATDAGKGIDQSTFGSCPSWPGVLYLMALVETQDSSCLSGSSDSEDERISVFQEYANGGLAILKDFFAGRHIDLDGLLSFIETQMQDSAGLPNLDLMI